MRINKHKSTYRMHKRIISAVLIVSILGSIIMPENISWLFDLLGGLTANAVDGLGEPQVHADIPECEFKDNLYDGSDAIEELPNTTTYRSGYSAPKNITFKEFRETYGTGAGFNQDGAQAKLDEGYKIMICDAEDLYNYSMLVNSSSSKDERAFYLSVNLVLGNNIEYSEVSRSKRYFRPIGNYTSPFTGTFDGQGFEIRDLYFNSSDTYVGLFGVISGGAVVQNFGIYHPYIDKSTNVGTVAAAVAVNGGTVSYVYVIVDEYDDHTSTTNKISVSWPRFFAGLVAENQATGTISNSYFAGRLRKKDDAGNLHPVCAENNGTVENCYYDEELFACKTDDNGYGDKINPTKDYTDTEVKPLTNIQLKKLTGVSESFAEKFKMLRAANLNSSLIYSSVSAINYQYPRLYGYTGLGTEADPFIISTPADLINFPCSYEYYAYFSNSAYYFKLGNCIDMSEAAPNAYKPQVNYDIVTNIISSGKASIKEYKGADTTAYPFRGKALSGEAGEDDSGCKLEHIHLKKGEGNLTECHMIYNLTIDTPADSIRSGTGSDFYFTALIGYAQNTTIQNLQIVGGEISTGSNPLMKSDNSYNTLSSNYSINSGYGTGGGYYTYTAAVCARTNGSSNDVNLNNVHSSATIRLGAGEQFGGAMGGLVASGYLNTVNNCSNSGDLIGGYREFKHPGYPNVTTERYAFGGVLGYTMSKSMENVVNYGNIYGVVLVGDGATTLGTGSYTNSFYAGISAYRLSTSTVSKNILNEGMIFDGPVVLDQNGEPEFEEVEGANGETIKKPIAEELDGSKKVLQNDTYSIYNNTIMMGIAYDYAANALNKADLYAVVRNNTAISGVGGYSNLLSRNFNRNDGNIYVFSGTRAVSGIASTFAQTGTAPSTSSYAYNSYNHGDIYIGNGAKLIGNTYVSGISNGYSQGCYNDGNIYAAPTNFTYSYSQYFMGCGYYGSGYDVYKNINAGKITVDYNTYQYVPISTSYPVYIQGTGNGNNNENYGIFKFIDNKSSNVARVNLYIAGCGHFFNTTQNSMNYSDIFVDVANSTSTTSLSGVYLYGIGNASSVSNCINCGDIAFYGRASSLNIDTLNAYYTTQNCINLGDVTIKEGSYINGAASVYGSYLSSNGGSVSDNMYGWYDGCHTPDGVKALIENNESVKAIFDHLDSNKRYGVYNISGYFNGNLNVYAGVYRSYSYSSSRIYTNGEVNINNASVNNLYVYGIAGNLSTSGRTTDSENNAPINIENVVVRSGTAYVTAGAGGSNNINYADINLKNVVSDTTSANFYISGMVCNLTNVSYKSNNLENRGNINITDMYTAVYNNTTYKAYPYSNLSTTSTGTVYVGGIGYNAYIEQCANFGKITLDRLPYRVYVGGIISYSYFSTNSTTSGTKKCINYGDIKINKCGTNGSYVGGIAAYHTGTPLFDNANFADIRINNPTSYAAGGSGRALGLSIGGVSGYANNVKSCGNYGDITYNNDRQEYTGTYNTAEGRENTSRFYFLALGGVTGKGAVSYSLNYGDMTVENEPNMTICAGGIVGYDNEAKTSYNFINYGNITVPGSASKSNTTSTNGPGAGVYAGGILGFATGATTMYYGINYGSLTTNSTIDNAYLGALVGGNYSSTATKINRVVDLMQYADSAENYSLIGTNTGNDSGAYANYTMHEATKDKSSNFGTVKNVQLDKYNGVDNNDDTEGLYYANFVFRKKLVHQKSESTKNSDNGLMYQDIGQLSPYLQAYMKNRFGDDICGAYVLINSYLNTNNEHNRKHDEFFPNDMKTNGNFTFGCTDDNYDNSTLIGNKTPTDELYRSHTTTRTMKSDLTYYAQQVQTSSMAEIYETGMETVHYYQNLDTQSDSEETQTFQKYKDYLNHIETNPARNEGDTNESVEKNDSGDIIANDEILYTDLYYYIAIDSIDSSQARTAAVGGETINTGGKIILNITNVISDKKSKVTVYDSGEDYDIVSDNETQRNNALKTLWPRSYNLTTVPDGVTVSSAGAWTISVPYNKDEPNESLKKIYTKVYGVITAEDGVHKNIVRVNVVLDNFSPSAKLEYVSLNAFNGITADTSTSSNTSYQSYGTYNNPITNMISTCDDSFTSAYFRRGDISQKDFPEKYKIQDDDENYTLGNGGLVRVANGKSLTDRYDSGEYKQDVPYYYMSDDIQATSGQSLTKKDGFKNIEYYSNSSNNVTLFISTENITDNKVDNVLQNNIWAEISYQDRLPSAEGGDNDYNKWWDDDGNLNPAICWNDDVQGKYKYTVPAYSTNNKEDPENQKTSGYATVTFNSQYMPTNTSYYKGIYYGGLYRIDLYYERTKNAGADTKKHFATVFFYKQHSPDNRQYYYGYNRYYDSKYDWGINGNSLSSYYANWLNIENEEKTDRGYACYYSSSNSYNSLTPLTSNTDTTAPLSAPFITTYRDRTRNDYWANTNSSFSYAIKAYTGNRTIGTDGTISGAVYRANTDSPNADSVKEIKITNSLDRIDVVSDSGTEAEPMPTSYYPASYHWNSKMIAEDTEHERTCDYEVISTGKYKYNYINISTITNPPKITISDAKIGDTKIEAEGGKTTAVLENNQTSPELSCTWTSSNVTIFKEGITEEGYLKSYPSYSTYINALIDDSDHLYDNDGYSTKKVKIYMQSIDPETGNYNSYEDITAEVLDEDGEMKENAYFEIFELVGSKWSFKLKNRAKCGMYKIVPYMTYHMDLRKASDNDIALYGYSDTPDQEQAMTDEAKANVTTEKANVYNWSIAYTPFYINKQPNNESYLKAFDVNNDTSVPFISEDETNSVPLSTERTAYINESSDSNEIHYDGYKADGKYNYETGDPGNERIDRFIIYSIVAKEKKESTITLTAPYLANIYQWSKNDDPTDTTSPIDSDGNIAKDGWEPLEPEDSDADYKVYKDIIVKYHDGVWPENSVTYYKVVAEDGKTSTVYTVNVIPAERNKKAWFEIAQDKEELKDIAQIDLSDIFDESEKVYQELIAQYGQVYATINELSGSKVEFYQTKWFTGETDPPTRPEPYKLKAHVYDISIDLPEGYDYDVYLLSDEMDSYQLLGNSINGLTGKRLLIGEPKEQNYILRIVLRHSDQGNRWGVNYLWNPDFSNWKTTDEKNYVVTEGGGLFNNYVYDSQ